MEERRDSAGDGGSTNSNQCLLSLRRKLFLGSEHVSARDLNKNKLMVSQLVHMVCSGELLLERLNVEFDDDFDGLGDAAGADETGWCAAAAIAAAIESLLPDSERASSQAGLEGMPASVLERARAAVAQKASADEVSAWALQAATHLSLAFSSTYTCDKDTAPSLSAPPADLVAGGSSVEATASNDEWQRLSAQFATPGAEWRVAMSVDGIWLLRLSEGERHVVLDLEYVDLIDYEVAAPNELRLISEHAPQPEGVPLDEVEGTFSYFCFWGGGGGKEGLKYMKQCKRKGKRGGDKSYTKLTFLFVCLFSLTFGVFILIGFVLTNYIY